MPAAAAEEEDRLRGNPPMSLPREALRQKISVIPSQEERDLQTSFMLTDGFID